MKRPIQRNVPEDRLVHRILRGLLLGAVLAPPAMANGSNDGFQYDALLNHPTEGQLKAEAHGRVMIYNGLDNEVVERALDKQFDRIGHMLFVGTGQPPADDDGGKEDSVDDDDC